jgi:II/X family phage/plasmid replication protein
MAKLNLSEATMRDQANIDDLPPRLQAVHQAWLDGHDVRAMFKVRRTFYRYRADLLLMLGIDIAIKRRRAESNVVPLRITLTGTPLQVPAWAKGTPLYFEPRAA